VIMNTVVGMIYFEDYKDMPGLNMAFFVLGVIITLIGVYLLSDRDGVTLTKAKIRTKGGKHTGGNIQGDDYVEEIVHSDTDNQDSEQTAGRNGVRNPFLGSTDDDVFDTVEESKSLNDTERSQSKRSGQDPRSKQEGRDVSSREPSQNLGHTQSGELSAPSKLEKIPLGENEMDVDIDVPRSPSARKNGNSHSRPFYLSWSWWARGGTRKHYTPLF